MTPDFSKALSAVFLSGLAEEFPVTSKVIAAIPNQKLDYRPDAKSKTALELAWHLAATDAWFLDCIAALTFELTPPEQPATVTTGTEMAVWYDQAIAERLPKLNLLSPEQWATPVNFYGIFQHPLALYLQFMSNHMVHHRGQLSTYLRAMGGKCPSIYGGSADEPMEA
ncbi:MAG: DinB family protein [Acidobacteriota bacterium]|jgi:uncharacterized damage-inducible protein DinB